MRGMLARREVLAKACHTGVFEHHAYKGEYLLGEYRNAENGMYQFKYLLGMVMISSTYFLEARGEACYKRESFAKCAMLFAPERWRIVEKATRVRQSWPERVEFPFEGNAIPQWVQAIIGPNYFEEAFLLIDEMVRRCSTVEEGSHAEA